LRRRDTAAFADALSYQHAMGVAGVPAALVGGCGDRVTERGWAWHRAVSLVLRAGNVRIRHLVIASKCCCGVESHAAAAAPLTAASR
jgi:hypothetical protein